PRPSARAGHRTSPSFRRRPSSCRGAWPHGTRAEAGRNAGSTHRGEELLVTLLPQGEVALGAIDDLHAETRRHRGGFAVPERPAPGDATHEPDTAVHGGRAELEPDLVVFGER